MSASGRKPPLSKGDNQLKRMLVTFYSTISTAHAEPASLMQEQPLALSADDSAQQKDH